MILPIKRYPNPILRKKAREIKTIEEGIEKIANDMVLTLQTTNGLGLAGNQVGILKRIIVVKIEDKPFVIINPKIIRQDGEEKASEGCLSFPSLFVDIKRFLHITFRGLDINGKEIEADVSGLSSRIIQHEIDHLDGILFIDRMKEGERKKALALWRRNARASRMG